MINEHRNLDGALIGVDIDTAQLGSKIEVVLADPENASNTGLFFIQAHGDDRKMLHLIDTPERVALARMLLTGLPLDQVREALPADLFTTDWAIQVTDTAETWSSYEDGILFASREAAAVEIASYRPPAAASGRVLRREVSEWAEG